MSKRHLTCIIPMRNEADSVKQLLSEFFAAAQPHKNSLDIQLILIDDGSTDQTWNELERNAETFDELAKVTLIRNYRSRGKSHALALADDFIEGDLVATLDGDLQDDPSELFRLIGAFDEDDLDLLVGWKWQRRDPWGKRFPSRIFNAVTSLVSGLRLHDHNCGLKIYSRASYAVWPKHGEMHRFAAVFADNAGYRVKEEKINHRPRLHGKSKFGWERLLRGAIDLLTVTVRTRFNGRPAHFVAGIGCAILLAGMASLSLLFLDKLTGESIGTRPLFTLSLTLLVLGIQLISLGILAELISAPADRPNKHRVATIHRVTRTESGAPDQLPRDQHF